MTGRRIQLGRRGQSYVAIVAGQGGVRLSLSGWIGVAILGFWVCVAVFGPALAPHSESEIVASRSFAPAGDVGLLGSDFLGRDVLSRLLYGARLTLGLAFATTAIAFALGVPLGFTSALLGGLLDGIISRLNDAIMAFPPIILIMVAAVSLGPSLAVLIVAVAVVEATRVFRLSRALASEVAVKEFVEVARARGEGIWWIISREIWPNTRLPLISEFGVRTVFAILIVSALSFIGLGVQPPSAELGRMVKENLQGLYVGSPAALLPAAAVTSLTVGINLIVDCFIGQPDNDD